MAWNVVIAGGGFGGAHAARQLERLLPKQSARLMLVNDVNFLLYTPFLPEAAAGTLEPRHVVTPLRDMLKRTFLRLGAVTAHDPAARTVQIRTHEGETEEQRYDQLVLALGSVSRLLPVPGLENAIGFKSLADAIWLRNHVIETLEAANASEDPERREELLTYVFVGGGYAGLEALAELQDFAADAMDSYPRARLQGMRWILVEATDRVLPEIDLKLAEYAARELRGRGIDIRLGTRLESAEPGAVTLSTGERIPTRTVVWTTGVAPHPSLAELSVPLDDHGRVRVDRVHAGRGHGRCLGARRLRRGPRSLGRHGQAVAADRSACDPPGPDGGPKRGRRARRRQGRAVSVSQQGRVRQPGSLQGGRPAGPVHVLGIPGLVDGAHVPHEPDPGHGAQDPGRRRLDRRPAVPAGTSPRSARSATRGRSAPRSTSAAAAIARSPDQLRRPLRCARIQAWRRRT